MTNPAFRPTDEQRAIIDHASEPLRVAAGAGTGKTTTIVHRLAATVRAGGDPARTLGITFTNKAAAELRSRLAEVLDRDPAGREPEVSTYHAFAASILDEFGARIGHRPGAAIVDDGHRLELAMRVLRSLDDTSLDLTALPQRRDELLTVAAALNDHLVDPEAVRASAPSEHDEVWAKRLALLEAAERYQALKEVLGVMEYGDLIRGAVALVEEHVDVATELRSRYDVVLLDEYQDTDPAQRRLLTHLFDHGMSVTAVGDTDQTIYEWRGASIDNFEQFPIDFPTSAGDPAATLPLSLNRRSDELIVKVANAVRDRLPAVTGSTGLRPGPQAESGSAEAAWLRTEADEAAWIASDIASRRDAGVHYRDMAVLARKRDTLRTVAAALKDAEIPYVVGSMGELLSVPEVADIVAWMRILADPTDEGPLVRIVLGGRYRLGMANLAVVRSHAGDSSVGVLDALLAVDAGEADPTGLTQDGVSAIASFSATYRGLLQTSQSVTVAAVAASILVALDYWSEIASLPEAASVTARINVSRFLDIVGRWHPLEGSSTLAAFLRYLDALDEYGRADELDAAVTTSEDAVQLLTVHAAKGLEWDEVYLPALSEKIFPSDVRAYHDPEDSATALPYPLRLDFDAMRSVHDTVDQKDRRRLLRTRHDHQEWRLAYVAVTRARHRVCATGHAWHGDNQRPKGPSELLTTIQAVQGVQTGPWVDDPGDRPEPIEFSIQETGPDPHFDDGWGAALRDTVADETWVEHAYPELASAVGQRSQQFVLELGDLNEPQLESPPREFTTSVTNLVALAECPLKFRWIHHDRLPRKPRRSAALGTAFHRRAELHNLGVVALEDVETVRYDSVEDDRPSSREADPWVSFERSRFGRERPMLVETPFEVTLDGRKVRGKVDAVYESTGGWEIVDYKSGSPSPTDAKLVQLQAYAIAARRGALTGSTPDDLTVTFAYFGTDPAEAVTEHVDAPWLAEAESTVARLLETAELGPFDPAPSPACRWCDFLHHCTAGKAYLAEETTRPSTTSTTNVTGPSLTS